MAWRVCRVCANERNRRYRERKAIHEHVMDSCDDTGDLVEPPVVGDT
jgi:hypothetical protein